MLTLCVSLNELRDPNDAFRIASIITAGCSPSEAYLVIEADVEPRRELADHRGLTALLVLVAALEKAGVKTLISHCSTEMILMKAAGATNCATGKFFNLRRFTRGRFDDADQSGGGQLPYWFEQSLLAFLRQPDILRIQQKGFGEFLLQGGSDNQWARAILQQFQNEPTKAWVAMSWRHYLAWFAATERFL